MQQTTNYSLPTYQGTDVPNLITGYNVAVGTIDTQMKANADAAAAAYTAASTADGKADTNASNITALGTRVSTLENGSFTPAAGDANFDVSKLSGAKVTANGIVYFPQSS